MINKIIEMLGKLPDALMSDLGLYVALGLTLIVFLVALVVSFTSLGDMFKFKKHAAAILKDNSAVNSQMQLMPVKVKKQYKRAMMTGTKPSDIVSADAAVITPYSHSALSHLPLTVIIGAVIATAMGVGISAAHNGMFTEAEGMIMLCGAALGGILALVSAIIASLSYRGALKKYEKLMDVLDAVAQTSGQQAQASPHYEQPQAQTYEQPQAQTYEQPQTYAGYEAPAEQQESYSDYSGTEQSYEQPQEQAQAFEFEAQTEAAESGEQTAWEQEEPARPEYEQTEYEPTESETQTEYETQQETVAPMDEQESNYATMQPIEEDEATAKARARAEAMAQLRAEQAQRARGNTVQEAEAPDPELEKRRAESRAAAQKRLEELKAQRDAQMRERREAQAQAQAAASAGAQSAPSVSAEDVIARIEKIQENGATVAEMREVTALLQKERKKPENQSPEMSKRLNEALSKLLKVMSSTRKK